MCGTLKHHPSCDAGLCWSVVVLQSGDQMSQPGGTVMLNCSMGSGLSMSSYTMLWYRQNHYGGQVEFLLTEYDKPVGHFKSSLEASNNNFSLQINELFLNDSSTYYCAASHSDAHRPNSHTNINIQISKWDVNIDSS
ncbi:Immunoglobulin lambda variable 5-45 [Scomber scombrus]